MRSLEARQELSAKIRPILAVASREEEADIRRIFGLGNVERDWHLLEAKGEPKISNKAVWIGGLLLAIILTVLSPLASANPDGLEWVAEQKGFLDISQEPLYQIIPDYVMPGLANEALATIAAGIIGVLIVFIVAIGTVWIRRSAKN